ncbi:MAG: FAD-binding oxidoreductase, partial [Gammaproteobacteria bacterium]|nr:FAD-binding oxidoreductase [Gammaproteobacteria bacterium]
MPEPDPAVLARRPQIADALRAIVGADHVIASETELKPFESDGLTAYRQPPMLVALPGSGDEVARVLRVCDALQVKVVPR